MSIALLIRQLRLEFSRDPDFSSEVLRYDVGELWQLWKANRGRHLQEGLNAQFFRWWIAHYEECLVVDGARQSYQAFINRLAQYAVFNKCADND